MTMATLTADLSCNFRVTARRSVGIDNPTDALQERFADALAIGTAADTANELYHATRTFSGATDNLDLTVGLTDALGQVIAFIEVVAFFLSNPTGNGTITIGNSGGNAFTGWFGAAAHTETVGAGGWVFHHAPGDGLWTVTAGTGDDLLISGTDTQSYSLVILGRNA